MKNFYVDGRLGLATINVDYSLSLASGNDVDLTEKVEHTAKWTLVTCIAKSWIVSGDLEYDDHAIMASVSKKGDVRSTPKVKLTSNGYKNIAGKDYADIFTLHQAYVRGMRSIILATERDGCCHLISVAYGRMSKVESIDSIVPLDVVGYENDRIVHYVINTGTKGAFIAGGENWTRRISLKLI